MNKFILLISMLVFAGCNPDVVYIDRETGQPVEPIKRMEQLDVNFDLVCFQHRQYYKFYYSPTSVFIPRYEDGSTLPSYCNENTLADGTQEK